MNEDKPKKHKRRFGIVEFLVFILFVGAILLLVLIFTGNNETRISGATETDTVSVLDCKASDPADKFFSYKTENSAMHEVKITFDNKNIDKLNYTYNGRYATNDDAKTALSWMQTDYNNYMGTTNTYQEDLMPTFSAVGTEAIINLYFSTTTFNPETAKFVFLTDDEYAGVISKGAKSIEKIYRGKGFSCILVNNK